MGQIDLTIDRLVPCLISEETEETVNTRFYQVKEKKALFSCNKRSGWYVNWESLFEDYEIYAISVENSDIFEGLIALERNEGYQAEHIVWMATAPHNNPLKTRKKKYIGVGGHLFAVAVQISLDNNFGGCIYGAAKSRTVLNHYMETFGAMYVSRLSENGIGGFVIAENQAAKLLEMYNFERGGV